MTDDAIYLKEWRIFARLTQEQLGKLLGVTGAQVSRIETGARDFDGRFLKAFKTAINKALDDLGEPPAPPHIRIDHCADALAVKPDENEWMDRAAWAKWRAIMHERDEQLKRTGNDL